jgi:hypothetical protein
MAQLRVLVLLPAALLASSACTPDKKEPKQVSTSESDFAHSEPFQPPTGPVEKCNLDPEHAGPLRRAGKATIELAGSGGTLSEKDVPALCGPMFDKDSDVLQVKAGEGLLFEVCVSEGLLQVSSFQRVAGAQPIRSLTNADGAEVGFNRYQGATFSTRGDNPADSIVFAPDFWGVTAKVHLKSEDDKQDLNGTITFACPIPNPAALGGMQPTPQTPMPGPSAPGSP